MIRINLLGIPKAKRGGKRAAAPTSVGEGPSTSLLVIIFVILLSAGLWGWYNVVQKQRDSLTVELKKATAENLRLSEVKAKYEAERRKSEQFEQRFKVIDQLKTAQTGPVSMLSMVADTITKTDQVWLEAMTDDGKIIDFSGLALSPNAVANLMANLEKSGKFKSVEIKETSQAAEIKELQAFKFELLCEKLAPGASSQPGAPAMPGAAGAPAKADKKS
jgi:Tfp pilus assembly protein PilN